MKGCLQTCWNPLEGRTISGLRVVCVPSWTARSIRSLFSESSREHLETPAKDFAILSGGNTLRSALVSDVVILVSSKLVPLHQLHIVMSDRVLVCLERFYPLHKLKVQVCRKRGEPDKALCGIRTTKIPFKRRRCIQRCSITSRTSKGWMACFK